MNPAPLHYDHLLIGTGQATGTLIRGLPEHERIAVVEGGAVGGSCVNTGCTPTKTLVASAKIAWQARRAGAYGVRVGAVEVDFAAAMARMNEVRRGSRDGLNRLLATSPNVTLVRGWARFTGDRTVAVGDRTVAVGERTLSADRVYVNVGARATVPDVAGLDAVPWVDNVGILELERLPEHLVVLGAGYIALELGQVFARFGARVTVVETASRVLLREDEDVAAEVRAILEGEGVRFVVGASAERVAATAEGGVEVRLSSGEAIVGSHLLVATGRRPNTDRLDAPAAGIELDDRGYITVDDRARSSAEGVYALGDVNGRGAFTHTSVHDAQVVLDELRGGPRTIDERDPIYAMYTDPPLGRVGLTEDGARERGLRVLRATMPMSDVARATEMGETSGFVKVLVDADTDRFVGAAVLGVHGDEVVGLFALAMSAGVTASRFRRVVLPHPTVGELMPFLLARLRPA
jgi:pyruvate/2-oxoglutarate dehydrogenase complex dihydrolipoamide dehydrogenase (E3) component